MSLRDDRRIVADFTCVMLFCCVTRFTFARFMLHSISNINDLPCSELFLFHSYELYPIQRREMVFFLKKYKALLIFEPVNLLVG